jgi:hypothetical protein
MWEQFTAYIFMAIQEELDYPGDRRKLCPNAGNNLPVDMELYPRTDLPFINNAARTLNLSCSFRRCITYGPGPGVHPAFYTVVTGHFPVVKWPRRGVDHPPSCSAEVKERV